MSRTRSRPVIQPSEDSNTRDACSSYCHARADPGSALEDMGLSLEFSPCRRVADIRTESDHGIKRQPTAGIGQEGRREKLWSDVFCHDVLPVQRIKEVIQRLAEAVSERRNRVTHLDAGMHCRSKISSVATGVREKQRDCKRTNCPLRARMLRLGPRVGLRNSERAH